MALPFYLWSKVALNNGSIDPTINFQEGQSPSSLNDSCRAVMADLAAFRMDISGSLLTTGTATAYVLATNQVFDTLAHMDKALLCVTFHVANGLNPTLAVDGLTTKPIQTSNLIVPAVGALLAGKPYFFTYNNTDNSFYLVGNP